MPAPQQIRRSVRIKGRGPGKTILRCSGEGYAVAFGGAESRLEMLDLAVHHEGPKPADVFRALRGEVHLRHCSFSGGIAQAKDISGDGVSLAKEVTGLIVECDVLKNQGNGISLRDLARVRLERNQCRGNGSAGINCWSNADPAFDGNECSGNLGHGIRLGGATLARLDGNICQANRRAGISCTDSSQPEVRGSQCFSNGLSGIQVKDDSKPVIEGNRCLENKASGIAFADACLGVARDNECLDNAHAGIGLADLAHPDLEENRCHRNGQNGIAFTGGAGGNARANQCFANGGCGINLEGKAMPALEDNECNGNQSHGICIASTVGKIRLRGNTGRDNRGELMRDYRKRGWFG